MEGSTSESATARSSITSFAAEFEKSISPRLENLRPGRIVTGKVIHINKDFVTVDIGFKSDGIVPTVQFENVQYEIDLPKDEGTEESKKDTPESIEAEENSFRDRLRVKLGDEVDVYVLALESDTGQVLLSHEKAVQRKIWDKVEELFKTQGTINGRVVLKVKGGLQVDIGIPAFLPGSQVDIRPHRNLDKFLNESFDFKVLKITRDKGNIVLSRRLVLLSERDQLRNETMKVLAEGVVMEGVVKNVTEYGAFIDLGGIDGLLHISDISWGRVIHPSEKLSVGQTVPVVILKYDGEKGKVSLGMKQLKPDPWQTIHERLAVGAKIQGRIRSIVDAGATVELEDGVEGFIPLSEMTWNKKVRNPAKLLSEGDNVECQIMAVEPEKRNITLSLKQLQPNPWIELGRRHPIGSRVIGKIRTIADFGLFVGLEEGIDGLVHISDISWTKRLKDAKEIGEIFKKGDDLETVVLGIDLDNERLSLGIKQISEDPWENLSQRYPAGSRVKGKITRFEEYGIFLEVEEGIEGLVHNSNAGLEKDKKASDIYKVGDVIESQVTNIDKNARRMSLSIKSMKPRQEKESFNQYMADPNDAGFGTTLAEIMQSKFKDNK